MRDKVTNYTLQPDFALEKMLELSDKLKDEIDGKKPMKAIYGKRWKKNY
jgi:hypothetical protein